MKIRMVKLSYIGDGKWGFPDQVIQLPSPRALELIQVGRAVAVADPPRRETR